MHCYYHTLSGSVDLLVLSTAYIIRVRNGVFKWHNQLLITHFNEITRGFIQNTVS